ncbi:MAG: hypothetical protein HYR90_00690 [Candidatus Andersenbacteria bacterium]|nr:hypothetical protein [Candidatus Andersenbacteria bacterium]
MSFAADLKSLGLSDKEAAVYMAALGLGPSTVLRISRRAQVARATTYLVLESLAKQGLITKYEEAGKILFVADNPHQLKILLERREKEFQESEDRLENLLPKLMAFVQSSDDRPLVKYYSGVEGLKAIRTEMTMSSKPGDVWRNLSPFDPMRKQLGDEEFLYVKPRRAKSIKSRTIFTTTSPELKKVTLENAAKQLVERRFINPKRYTSTSGFTVFPGKVGIGTFSDNVGGVIIESESVAQMMTELFDAVWESLK